MSIVPHPGLLGRGARVLGTRAPALVATVSLVAIAADLGHVIVGSVRPGPPRTEAVAANTAALLDRRALGALFGDRAEQASATTATATALELTGTIAMATPADGYGIIRSHSESEHTYGVGQALPGGLRLLEVYRERVVVQAGGRRMMLWLPRQGSRADGLVQTALRPLPAQTGPDPILAQSPLAPTTIEERREHPLNVRGTPMTRALHASPFVVKQHIVGYSVASSDGESPIPGLPRGAVIREINGTPLTDGLIAATMLDSLATGGAATFVILAGDDPRTITLDVSNLAALVSPQPRRD